MFFGCPSILCYFKSSLPCLPFLSFISFMCNSFTHLVAISKLITSVNHPPVTNRWRVADTQPPQPAHRQLQNNPSTNGTEEIYDGVEYWKPDTSFSKRGQKFGSSICFFKRGCGVKLFACIWWKRVVHTCKSFKTKWVVIGSDSSSIIAGLEIPHLKNC